MSAKRYAAPWEIADQRLHEAQGWMAVCTSAAANARHPRQAEFLRRWCEADAKLGMLRLELECLADECQGAGFPCAGPEVKP